MDTLRESENVSTVDCVDPGVPKQQERTGSPVTGEKEDVVPEGGYGWVNVGCIVAQNSVTWGEFDAIVGGHAMLLVRSRDWTSR